MSTPRQTAPATKAALARRVWGMMFRFLMQTAPQRTAALGRHGLTPNDARALSALDRTDGRPMGALSQEWHCDASYATGVIDRLEDLGLAERRAVPHDRRVKHVVLTARGGRVRDALMKEYLAPPATLRALSRADLDRLRRLLEKLEAMGGG